MNCTPVLIEGDVHWQARSVDDPPCVAEAAEASKRRLPWVDPSEMGWKIWMPSAQRLHQEAIDIYTPIAKFILGSYKFPFDAAEYIYGGNEQLGDSHLFTKLFAYSSLPWKIEDGNPLWRAGKTAFTTATGMINTMAIHAPYYALHRGLGVSSESLAAVGVTAIPEEAFSTTEGFVGELTAFVSAWALYRSARGDAKPGEVTEGVSNSSPVVSNLFVDLEVAARHFAKNPATAGTLLVPVPASVVKWTGRVREGVAAIVTQVSDATLLRLVEKMRIYKHEFYECFVYDFDLQVIGRLKEIVIQTPERFTPRVMNALIEGITSNPLSTTVLEFIAEHHPERFGLDQRNALAKISSLDSTTGLFKRLIQNRPDFFTPDMIPEYLAKPPNAQAPGLALIAIAKLHHECAPQIILDILSRDRPGEYWVLKELAKEFPVTLENVNLLSSLPHLARVVVTEEGCVRKFVPENTYPPGTPVYVIDRGVRSKGLSIPFVERIGDVGLESQHRHYIPPYMWPMIPEALERAIGSINSR